MHKRSMVISALIAVVMAFVTTGVVMAAPAATVTIGGGGDIFIGTSSIELSATFDNTAAAGSANIGYGPFIDIYFPVNGADGAANTSLPLDGIDYIADSATYLGISVTEVIQVFPDSPLGENGCGPTQSWVEHPYAVETNFDPVTVCGIPGDKLVTFQLPFGSFTPEQPPATVEFQASLHDYADLAQPLTLRAQGGFQFGNDPLDNPCCDPSIPTTRPYDATTFPNTGTITPTLLEIEKEYNGPEDETATGPNYSRSYTVTVTAAPDQTIEDLDVFDYLDDNIVITGVNAPGSSSITIGGVAAVFPIGPLTNNGTTNELIVNYASMQDSVSFTISFYVPLRDASGNPVVSSSTGSDGTTENRAYALGDWDPLDPRDAGATDNALAGNASCPGCPPLVTHEDSPIVIQKTVTNLTDSANTPGDVLEYTLDIQLSDFFALDDVEIFDVISDGQRITGPPQIIFFQHGTPSNRAIDAAYYEIREYFTGGADSLPDPDVTAIAGDTVLYIDLSGEVEDSTSFTELLGGCVPDGGTGGGDPDCSPNLGATSATIRYQTTIQDAFTDQFPSNDASVDEGDTLMNTVEIRPGVVLDTATLAPTGGSYDAGDNSGAEVEIVTGTLEKTIYGIREPASGNVNLSPGSSPQIRPGDEIIFRLRYTMPSTDFENFILSDYLPLPVMDANEIVAFDDVISDGGTSVGTGIPAAGRAMWGPTPGETNFAAHRATLGTLLENGMTVPTLIVPGGTIPISCDGGTISAEENSVAFCFGDFDDPTNTDSIVDILFSVTVSNQSFADGLFLTNFAQSGTGSTNAGTSSSDEIIGFELREPILQIKKGIIDSTNPNEEFSSQTTPSGTTFADAGTGGAPFTGSIETSEGGGSGNVDGALDADASGLDANDTVRYAVTIQNTGGSGAFDIKLTDSLPTGLVCNPANLNLSVTLGDGTSVAYTTPSGNDCDFFINFDGDTDDGIELIDPSAGTPVCQHPGVDPALAVIIITYDLVIDTSVASGDEIINTATLTNYAATDGGPNFLGNNPSNYPNDDASITIEGNLEKTIVSTSDTDSSDVEDGTVGNERPVLIGEVITYSISHDIPEGTTTNLQFRDNLPDGLTFAGNATVTFDSDTGISSSDAGIGTGGPIPAGNITGGTVSGEDVTFSLGTISNSDNDDDAESVTVTFDAVVVDIPANQAGVQLVNDATLFINSNEIITSETRTVEIIEPDVDITKVNDVTGVDVDSGDTVEFTLTVENTGTSPAYNIEITDTLPAIGASYLTFSALDASTSTCDDLVGWSIDTASPPAINFTLDRLADGDDCTIIYSAIVPSNATPGETYTNTVEVTSFDSRDNPADPGNRNYTGGSDSSDITTPDITIAKSSLATSEDHTDPGDTRTGTSNATEIPLAIGEIIRFRLEVTLIEGEHENLTIADNLPTGLDAIYDSAFTVTIPASVTVPTAGLTSGTTTSIYNDDGTEAVAGLNTGNPGNISLRFNGTTTNADTNNGTDEIIVVEFNALLLNSTAASNDRGEQRDNSATVNEGGGQSTGTSNVVNTRIREPLVTVDKVASPTSGDAGDTITFTLTIANDNNAYGATAYNLNVVDVLPANYSDVTVTSIPSGATDNSSGNTIDVVIPSLAQNASVTITYTADIILNVAPADVVTNTADLTWTSLPGNFGTDDGTGGNNTGSSLADLDSDQGGGYDSGEDGGERTGSATNANDYNDSDSADVIVDNVAPVKALFATSEGHTSEAFDGSSGNERPVAIGEVVTFQLTTGIPEGVSQDVVLSDVLVPGLSFIDGTVTVYTNSASNMDFADITGTIPTTPTGLAVPADGDGAPTNAGTYRYDAATRTLEINLGDITNQDDDADDEQVIVLFNVVVANDTVTGDTNSNGVNDLGDIWANVFSASVAGNTPVDSNPVSVVVEEPQPTITKTINAALSNPATGPYDAGDTVVYDIVVSNPSTANIIDAFELDIVDDVDANLNLTNPIAFIGTINGTPTDNSDYLPVSGDGDGQSVIVSIDQLEPGESLTIRVTTTVLATVTDGQIIANQSDLTWTSLPGDQGTSNQTPGDSGDSDGERNGSGGTNDYSDTDTVNFTVGGTYTAEKSITATSETHTDDSGLPNTGAGNVPVVVGEVLRYRLVTGLAEGTNHNLSLSDQLSMIGSNPLITPIFDDTFTVTFQGVGAGLITSSTYGASLEAANGSTVSLFDAGGTPQFASLVDYSASTNLLELNFGDLVNADNDSGVEYLIVDFNVVVMNNADVNLSDIIANNYVVISDDVSNNPITRVTSNTVNAIVQEPGVSLTKSINATLSNPATTGPYDAGDTVVYDIVVSNPTGTNITDAFDLNIVDGIDANLDLTNPIAFVGTITGSSTDNSDYTAPGQSVDVTVSQLAPGESLTIRVTTTVRNTVTLAQVIANEADVTYTSLPGTGTASNPTGSTTPGTNGATNGERDGSGSVNDYTDTDNVDFTVGGPVDAAKSIAGTSVVGTDDTTTDTSGDPRPVAIGELVTYRLVTGLPESTSTTLQLSDILADGIEYEANSARVSYLADNAPTFVADFSGIQNETTPTFVFPASRINFDTGSRELTFDFGAVVNNDGDSNTENIIVEFDVRVVDDTLINNLGDIWSNSYDVIIDEGLPSEIITPSADVYIEVVEPAPTLTKSFSSAETGLGSTVTMTLVASNLATDGANAPIYDVNVTDVLDDWLHVTDVDVSFNTEATAFGSSATDNSVITPGYATGVTDNIAVLIDGLPVDGVATITVTLVVDPNGDSLQLPRTINNIANLAGDSLPGEDTVDRDYTDSDTADLDIYVPVLLVSKTDSADPVNAGDTLNYTITIENPGTPNYSATQVVFTDELPTGYQVTLVVPSQGTCSPIVGGILTCNLGTIASGGNATVTINGRVGATVVDGAVLNNVAYVTSQEGVNGNDGNDTPDDGDDARAEEETTIGRDVDLEIEKTVNDSTPNEGDLITYTLLVTNNGPSDAANVVVTDTLPIGVTYTTFTPNTLPCAFAPNTLTCTFPMLDAGDFVEIGIRARVGAGTSGTTITNTASVTSDEPETDTSNNSDDVDINVDDVDLAVTKSVNNTSPAEGGTIIYSVTVINNGPAPATGVTVTDDLNALNGVTYVSDNAATLINSASTPTSYNSATGVWTIGRLNAGASLTLQIAATVDVGAGSLTQPLVNTAAVSGVDQPDSDNTNDSDDASISVDGVDLSLEKVVDRNVVDEGETITYGIIVTNESSIAATNVVVTDDLFAVPVTYISHVAPTGTTYNPTTGEWSIPSIPGLGNLRLSITVSVNGGTAGTQFPNEAEITSLDQVDGDDTNNSDDEIVRVRATDVQVTKSVDNPTAAEGDTVVYSISVTNNGPSRATNITVEDNLPTGLTYVSDNAATLIDSATNVTTYNPATGVWSVGLLNAGSSLTLEITTTINAGTTGTTLNNTATITNVEEGDTNSANDDDSATIAVSGLDLSLTKAVDNPAPNVGDTVVYHIVVVNNGPANATGVVVTDDFNTLPGLSYISDNSASSSTTYNSATGEWTIGNLASGATIDLFISAQVQASAVGTAVTNTAAITDVDQPDSNPTNNEDDAVIGVGTLDIEVEKVVDNPAPSTGDNVTYTITVTNNGPSNATGIILDENLPLDGVSLTYVSDTPSQGTFTPVPAGSTWAVGNLASGASATLQLTVTVNITDGSIVNTASLNSVDQPDSNPDNNTDTATIVLGGTDLAVDKTVDNTTPEQGGSVTYTIVATNNGPVDATNVVVVDILPPGITYISDNAATVNNSVGSPTSFDPGTGNWTIGELNNGESLSLQIAVTVDVNGGSVRNTAEISGDQPDSNPDNDIDDAIISVDGADLSLTKSVNTSTPQVGQDIVYTLTVSNSGPSTAFNVEVTDTLPGDVTYNGDHVASQGTFDGSLWVVGQLNAGQSASLQMTVRVTGNTGNTTNIAEVTRSDQPDPDSTPGNGNTTEDDYAASNFAFDPPFGRKVFDDNGLPLLEWRIEWVNPGTQPLAITVVDPIPDGTTYEPGSLTCTSPSGILTVNRCAYNAGNDSVVFEGVLFPDPGATPDDITAANNRLIMTFLVDVDDDVEEVNNEAMLNAITGDTVSTSNVWRRPEEPAPDDDGGADTPAQEANIRINKSAYPAIAFPGEELAWIIEVANDSGVDAYNVRVTDSIPAQLTIINTIYGEGSVTVNDHDVTWQLGTVPAGASYSLRIVTRVPADLNEPVANTAYLSGDNIPPQESQAVAAIVEQLPATGETPLWSFFLKVVGPGVIVALVSWLFLRR